MTTTWAPADPGEVVFEESLRATRRDWRWFPIVVVAVFLSGSPILAGITALAWGFNVFRFWGMRVVMDSDHLWVGTRSVRLCALELPTLGQAGNTWPWRTFNRRYLGANPFWTNDSVGLRGLDGGKRYWIAIGTNHRDALVDALTREAPRARERAIAEGSWSVARTISLPPPGWHADPWDPTAQQRWWDGAQWTGWTAPKTGTPPPGTGSDPE